jgi:ElaB/YqjD/DUF883 family membrane-anchored ribosome-binding protein
MERPQNLNALIADVEELLAELGDRHGPDVSELRTRLEKAIASARGNLGDAAESATARLGRYVGSIDDYINDYPRLAFFTALMVAGVVAFFAGVASGSKK